MDGGLIMNLRGVNPNPGADPDDMVSLRLWASDGLIISAIEGSGQLTPSARKQRRALALRPSRRSLQSWPTA